MALRRCTTSVDGTIPIPALLYDDEELLASQETVGIYDGLQKSPNHQAGTVHISSHRLFYIDNRKKIAHSFALELSYVTKTEYYAGLFKSSPKVTLYLSAGNSLIPGAGIQNIETSSEPESWECGVCSYRNPPGLSPAAARICALCGVPRSSIPTAPRSVQPQIGPPISSSLPSSAIPSSLFASSIAPLTSPDTLDPTAVACPGCTFLNHPSLPNCEICSTPLPELPARRREQNRFGMISTPSTRAPSPDIEDEDEDGNETSSSRMIKLSFRKGGDKSFYAVLRRSLMTKAWEAKGIGKRPTTRTSTPGSELAESQDTVGGRSGINGILRTVETSAQSTATDMSDALKDLEALMVKAKDMVRLAAELNERLTAATSTATPATSNSGLELVPANTAATATTFAEPEEVTFIRSSLSQLGLQMPNAPVTQDMIRDEHQWTEELARELARVLQGPRDEGRGQRKGDKGALGLMGNRGIIALDEVWCGWNRARGVALIPPSTFLLVLPHLSCYTDPPIRPRAFPSGLTVLHTPPYTHAAFTSRLVGLLALAGPQTTMGIAQEEKITIGLAMEMIGVAEADGHICRDDGSAMIVGGSSGGGAEVRWWKNVFREYVWDGHE